jgi:hypothetical protein
VACARSADLERERCGVVQRALVEEDRVRESAPPRLTERGCRRSGLQERQHRHLVGTVSPRPRFPARAEMLRTRAPPSRTTSETRAEGRSARRAHSPPPGPGLGSATARDPVADPCTPPPSPRGPAGRHDGRRRPLRRTCRESKLAFVISGPCAGRSESTDRTRRGPAPGLSGDGAVPDACFSRKRESRRRHQVLLASRLGVGGPASAALGRAGPATTDSRAVGRLLGSAAISPNSESSGVDARVRAFRAIQVRRREGKGAWWGIKGGVSVVGQGKLVRRSQARERRRTDEARRRVGLLA